MTQKIPVRFYMVLANTLVASLTNNAVWFAVVFWVYLQTRSVMATSVMAGIYLGSVACSGFFLGAIVDRYRKKAGMMLSSVISLALYAGGLLIFLLNPGAAFKQVDNPGLWVFIVLCLSGAIAGNIRTIALSTLVTLLVQEKQRDRANGLVGTVNGISFLVASVFSGMIIGFMGISWMLILALALTVLCILHLFFIRIEEKRIVHTADEQSFTDIRGTLAVIRNTAGLMALIFFNTFNNFLGGVFMSLMDAYGLSLVSVQVWGILWAFLSTGFIIGGMAVARKGLGNNPLYTLFITNIVMWVICSIFTMHNSLVLLTAGLFLYLCLIPVVEAAEQTIIQRVIPLERQGRVFGFAQSIEQAASPVTAFIIGPIAQYIFIPYMTTGAGVRLIGNWFGTGSDRGLALLFTLTGLIGLAVTVFAMKSRAYKTLSAMYARS